MASSSSSSSSSSEQYRQYADECLKWAKQARSQEEREALLQLAEDWLQAALKSDPPSGTALRPH